MVPFLVAIFIILWNGNIFVSNIQHSSGLVLFLSGRGNYHHFLKWDHYCRRFLALLEWYHFRFRLLVPLLFLIFYPVLKWYHSVKQFSSFFWNGTIFVDDFWYFSLMVPFMLPNFFRKFLNCTFFVPKFLDFSQMVPFLFQIFCTLLE